MAWLGKKLLQTLDWQILDQCKIGIVLVIIGQLVAVALSSEQSPQTPAYASTQNSKKISSGIYFLDSAHK